jgi:5'-nucleotidase
MKRIYVDMDEVLCDFKKGIKKSFIENPYQKFPQSKWGFFLKLEPMPDAIESFNLLKEEYDMYILTRPSFMNVNCYTEKVQWVWDHLGFDVVKKTILIPDKSLVKGDYLIDDSISDGQNDFEGELIRFGSEKFPTWKEVVEYLI